MHNFQRSVQSSGVLLCISSDNAPEMVVSDPDRTIPAKTGWIGAKFFIDINGFQTINPNDFGDPHIFPQAPP